MRRTFLAVLVGLLSGLASTLFLYLLHAVTLVRFDHPLLLCGLPLAGLLIGWIYQRWGREVSAGHRLILDEIHDPKKVVPLRMAPMILFSTVLTHLVGGSAGREGTAVQMGASLGDQLSRWFRVDNRRALLMAGAAAGFGSAVGAPWAGMVFGLEVIHEGKIRLFAAWECAIASFVGFAVTHFLHAPHSIYPRFNVPAFSSRNLLLVAVAGILFGLAARLFLHVCHRVERAIRRLVPYAPLRPALAGVLLLALFLGFSWQRYTGLGISVIQEALLVPAPWLDPWLKGGLTALTVGTGFKGGEFIPLVFIGTTLGSSLGLWFPQEFALLAAVGFAAVFAGAANTPLACVVMAIEIFGWPIAPYALVGCCLSFVVSGRQGIYSRVR